MMAATRAPTIEAGVRGGTLVGTLIAYFLGACLAAGLAAGPAAADDADLPAARAALDQVFAAKLDALAGWCTKKRLYGRRDATFAVLLEVDPDHAEARKRLKYAKDDAGVWVQKPKYKPATNWNRDLVPESEERLGALRAEHVEAALDLYSRADSLAELLWARREVAALQSRHPAAKRPARVLRALGLSYYRAVRERGLVQEMAEAATFLRTHHPQDFEIRAALGEVLHEDVWVLAETARTLKRAGVLAKAAQSALAAVETKPAALDEDEAKIELPWKTAAGAPDVRVVGTADEALLRSIAAHAQAVGAVLEAGLATKPVRRKGLTLVVLAGAGEDDTFIDAYPVVDNPSLQQRKKLGLDLVFLHGQGMLLRKNPPDAQLDLAVNTVLNQVFSDTFLKSEAPRGWHAEGLSRYLAYTLLGTRLSINVVGKYAGQGGDRHVPESKDSWLASARAQLKKNKQVGLQMLLGKGVDTFNVRDAVLAYAFAAYLIEAHAGLVAGFVRIHVESSDVDKACREILGMPRTVTEQRFTRWLDEILAAQAAAPVK